MDYRRNRRPQLVGIALDPDHHVAGEEVPRLAAQLIHRRPGFLLEDPSTDVGDDANDVQLLRLVDDYRSANRIRIAPE